MRLSVFLDLRLQFNRLQSPSSFFRLSTRVSVSLPRKVTRLQSVWTPDPHLHSYSFEPFPSFGKETRGRFSGSRRQPRRERSTCRVPSMTRVSKSKEWTFCLQQHFRFTVMQYRHRVPWGEGGRKPRVPARTSGSGNRGRPSGSRSLRLTRALSVLPTRPGSL